jgi:cellulose synthase/poly-beta-1,6-N-acetylglucosamine synthase-like glycosyltransferase
MRRSRLTAAPPLVPAVVVPARDEAALLPRCILALDSAARAVDPPVDVVVVLDACTDDSADVLATMRDELTVRLTVLTTEAASVGSARAAGAAHLLDRSPARSLWLATTDADSAVRPDWLNRHLHYAAAGAALVAGTVVVDSWTGWPVAVRRRYNRGYARPLDSGGHGHVHGANLGIRGDLYQQLGGFPALPTGEDIALVAAATAAGAAVMWATDIPVITSSRRTGRAPSGFAATLARLGDRERTNEA